MRIVAGSLRGRLLAGPSAPGIRPTSDRVRGAIFNILTHGIDGFTLESARVLDLFAGVGALGLEALSRDAAFCEFVEMAPRARALIQRNIDALGVTGSAHISSLDATRLGRVRSAEPFHLVFLDPPYGKGLSERALASASEGRWLAPDAVAVVEERAGTLIDWPSGFIVLDERRWGATQASFARYQGSP